MPMFSSTPWIDEYCCWLISSGTNRKTFPLKGVKNRESVPPVIAYGQGMTLGNSSLMVSSNMCFFLFVLTMLCISCSYNPFVIHPVEVVVPSHPWEESDPSLWMRLVTSQGEVIHMDSGTKKAVVYVPLGKTLFIVAYPLGSYEPFGGAVTATDT